MDALLELPLDAWEAAAAESSVAALAGQTDYGKPVTVKPLRVKKRPAVITGAMYGGLEGHTLYGFWLVAEDDYIGEVPMTTRVHDEDAIQEGRRRRGDMTGVRVIWNGQSVVAQGRFVITATLPSTILSLSEAAAFDATQRSAGWRAMWMKTPAPVGWWLLGGHPVVEYGGLHGRCLTLFFRNGGSISEVRIDSNGPNAEKLVPVSLSPTAAALPKRSPPPEPPSQDQLALIF